jgi:hypothetical protein
MAFVLSGEMMLWEAVSNRDLPEVRRLLAKGGGDPNMLCPDSFVRLHASEKFRAGQAQNTGRSLLHHAAWAGDLEVFKAIVDAGGDIDRKRNTVWRPNGGVNGRGNKPLHFAVMYNRKAIVEYLLDLGADVNAAGEQGYTPLHISVKFNFPELMELLLLSGARTDMITRDEKTARDMAKWGGENTTEAMGDILQLFDRCEAECKARGAAVGQRYEPGAPLQQLEPWLHATGGRRGAAPRLGGGTGGAGGAGGIGGGSPGGSSSSPGTAMAGPTQAQRRTVGTGMEEERLTAASDQQWVPGIQQPQHQHQQQQQTWTPSPDRGVSGGGGGGGGGSSRSRGEGDALDDWFGSGQVVASPGAASGSKWPGHADTHAAPGTDYRQQQQPPQQPQHQPQHQPRQAKAATAGPMSTRPW